jgi:hypothetical protein
MKGKLNKVDNGYVLLVNNIMYATDNDKLSKSNCDELFGVVDVEKLADYHFSMVGNEGISSIQSFKIGFNKAMELNKDKVFTLEDMGNLWDFCVYNKGTFAEFIQSIQKPEEIEVEIETETKVWEFISNGEFESFEIIPKLDSNKCLILKKI